LSRFKRFGLVNSLQQFSETIVNVTTGRRRPFGKRTAKCGGDSSLVGQIINSDQSSFHRMIACGVLIRFN